jgi:hypothetical protein
MTTIKPKRSMRYLVLLGALLLASWLSAPDANAYERYKNSAGAGNCSTCHGDFTGPVSPKGTVFPGDDKHQMHRSSGSMDADCNLCHVSIGDNPLLGASAGTANNVGYGCTGCHGRLQDGDNGDFSTGWGAGLRQHHTNAGIATCTGCHDDADPGFYTPVAEDILPAYYGTVDTNVDDPCNDPPSYLENWSIGDTQGLDNDQRRRRPRRPPPACRPRRPRRRRPPHRLRLWVARTSGPWSKSRPSARGRARPTTPRS